jgi:hypothetical protein
LHLEAISQGAYHGKISKSSITMDSVSGSEVFFVSQALNAISQHSYGCC